MGLFSALQTRHTALAIKGKKVFLRPPVATDFAEWRDLRLGSRAFLEPWEATWTAEDHERSTFRFRVNRYDDLRKSDLLHAYFIMRAADEALLGGVTLSNVRRGIADTATLGYWIGERHARQGYMTDALNALAHHAFAELGLHRLEAACLPANTASRKLLQRCSFEQEGYARAYLKIAGQWEDHLLFARLREN